LKSETLVASPEQEQLRRPSLAKRLLLWLSPARCIDGLWVGSLFQENAEASLQRVEAALRLIETCDRPRYDRLRRDLDRIWVCLLTIGAAQFDPALRACLLDERFLLDEATDAAIVAAVIVHEATHARLWHRGIGYEEERRTRVEAICLRRELAFARRLPDGSHVRHAAEAALAMSPSYWTNAASQDRELEGRVQVLKHLERNWLARLALAIHRRRLRRAERRKERHE
jgi:hypothetical protein